VPTEQMNISITPQLARYVRGKVRGGRYTNASEVVRDALRLMLKQEEVDATGMRAGNPYALSPQALEEHGKLVAEGDRALDRGEYMECDEGDLSKLVKDISARGRRRLATARSKSS